MGQSLSENLVHPKVNDVKKNTYLFLYDMIIDDK